MKVKTLPYIVLLIIFLFGNQTFSQDVDENKDPKTEEKKRKVVKKKKIIKRVKKLPKKKKYPKKKIRKEPYIIEEDSDFYSVFTDFRIPVRDHVNESDLLYEGWVTDEARYAFRCRNEKRVRLTFWQLISKNDNTDGSEFINVTPEEQDCLDSDLAFAHNPPKAPKIKLTKKLKPQSITSKSKKEIKVTKFDKDIKKKKKKKWVAPKK